jgi:hypothetical protein
VPPFEARAAQGLAASADEGAAKPATFAGAAAPQDEAGAVPRIVTG